MRTITENQYTLEELRDSYPEGYARALMDYQDRVDNDPYVSWQEETLDSLLACLEACGLRRGQYTYELGAYSPSFIRVRHDADWLDLRGPRALAWFENHVLGPLRVPFTPMAEGGKRRQHAKYGTRAGSVPPCPFTGFCTDDDYLDAIRESLKGGESVREAIGGLAFTYQRFVEAEWEYRRSPEGFADWADCHTQYFTESGELRD